MNRPEDHFVVHGFFEEIGVQIGDSFRCLGTRVIEDPRPQRELGVYGRRDYTFVEPMTLTKGHKTVVVKASLEKPLVCFGHAQALCGRTIKPFDPKS